MSNNSVQSYTNEQLLNRVKGLKNLSPFKYIPKNKWIVGVRSEEDKFNETDDKFYLFEGEEFIMVMPGTTNAGKDLLRPTNPKGEGVIKADEIYYDVWGQRTHNGKVWAWCQRGGFWIHRDNDRDRKTEELGEPIWNTDGGFNFHPMSYIKGSKIEREFIDGWSLGCQCPSVRADFDEVMKLTKAQKYLTYALLNEFEV